VAFPNKYARRCDRQGCAKSVLVGEGLTVGPPWRTYCKECLPAHLRPAPTDGEDLDVQVDGPHFVTVTLCRPMGDRFAGYRAACEAHGARFDGARRCNVVSVGQAGPLLARLSAEGFTWAVDAELVANLHAHAQAIAEGQRQAAERVDLVSKALAAKGSELYPFQKMGVAWLATRDRALLADEMGLGKTIQVVTAHPKGRPLVVVCPAVAKGVWARELKKWRPEIRVHVCAGRGSFRWAEPGEAVIVNYDILPEALSSSAGGTYSGHDAPEGTTLAADEAHALKSPKSRRTARFRDLSRAVRDKGGRVWLVTATPLLGRPSELYSVLTSAGLEREAFGKWDRFLELFAAYPGKWGGYEWGEPSPEVPTLLAKVSLRRVRADVLPELPEKTYQDVPVELGAQDVKRLNKSLPDDWERTVEQAIDDAGGVPFVKMSKARATLAAAKLGAALEICESYEEQGEPLLVFSAHSSPLDVIGAREGWAKITGETSAADRTQIEERFQRGELKGIAANIQAGGVAITLTRGCHQLFVDQSWTPALNWQAEDRQVRIGQKRAVLVMRLVADHALDERVAALLDKKRALLGKVGL